MELDFSGNEHAKETAILFSCRYAREARDIYRKYTGLFPDKMVYLVAVKDVLCAAKCDSYESYVIVGTECPLHPFTNAIYYRKALPADVLERLASHPGPVVLDSVYALPTAVGSTSGCTIAENTKQLVNEIHSNENDANSENGKRLNNNETANSPAHYPRVFYTLPEEFKPPTTPSEEDNTPAILVVTEEQRLLDYYTFNYENILGCNDGLTSNSRMRHLMRENINGDHVRKREIFGVIYTSQSFEDIAQSISLRLNRIARAYKIFLKDISYERLISMDHIDCIVLVDCPVFQCDIPVHIPIISPFSVETGLSGEWQSAYNENRVEDTASREIIVRELAGPLMQQRSFQGVKYRNSDDEEDMEIHEGRTGTATHYDTEPA